MGHIARLTSFTIAILIISLFLQGQVFAQQGLEPRPGTVTSQAAPGIPVPASVRMDFASDVEDAAPFLLAMEEALKVHGIGVAVTSEYILTVRLGQGRLSYLRGTRRSRADLTASSPLDYGDTLLGKKTLTERSDNAQLKVPLGKKRPDTSDVSISFTLFKPGQSPIWLANASAPDDGQDMDIQASRLIHAGIQSIGKTETRPFGE